MAPDNPVQLSKDDLDINVPDFVNRSGVFPLHDVYGNSFASIGSISNFTFGKFRVCYDQNRMPTPYGLGNARIMTNHAISDLAFVHALQGKMAVQETSRQGIPVAPALDLTAFQNSYFTRGNGTSREEATMPLTASIVPLMNQKPQITRNG
ncbi:uncharacterized protein CC84DRAFT_1173198 [Paraphaeosphaeria sporulosa]|uniref:DUF1254 domain-containing protein n=1 Tax=Paraphaeosphaeria sporulosa TaxID=1460663 RepID=A0A177CVX0_9PLEO|nr:uncharacterized protein CC84DRAFT_1173198 [Paraphaeosphaeria sporulosa]OAG10869.1 hypothetical protein CC84DRAFT_1173198 [Paraphaeosphaeria sporulosa]